MTDYFARRGAAYLNELNRSLGALVGIAQGILCDGALVDEEIRFLEAWLAENDSISTEWPGDVVHQRVKAALSDGVISAQEREHLVRTLQDLVGGSLEDLSASKHVTQLAFDEVDCVEFGGSHFCLTGEFVFAPRDKCAVEIQRRGGVVIDGVTKKLRYLVIGGLGSPEWKHGSFGTKIEKAMRYKREGIPILVVHEDRWASSLAA